MLYPGFISPKHFGLEYIEQVLRVYLTEADISLSTQLPCSLKITQKKEG